MGAQDDTRGQAAVIEGFADALYSLLHERAQSIGILDIAVEVNEPHVDVELLFASGPDLGASVDTSVGVARYCELLGDDAERWLDTERDGLAAAQLRGEAAASAALRVLDGLLEARRSIVRGGREA